MTTKNNKTEYGLLLTTEYQYGTRYVRLEVISREEGYGYPRGVCDGVGSGARPKHLAGLALSGLGMYGFVTDSIDHEFIGHEVEYRNVFAIDRWLAERMAKTLAKVHRALAKVEAREPGDKLIALAQALKLSFVVERIINKPAGRAYNDDDWRWHSIATGRDRYRALIEEARNRAVTGNASVAS